MKQPRATAFDMMPLVMSVASAQPKRTTCYAPVNGLKMYYEVLATQPVSHSNGERLSRRHAVAALLRGVVYQMRKSHHSQQNQYIA